MKKSTNELCIAGVEFERICEIVPDLDRSGRIIRFMPQKRYAKSASSTLHRHGKGPFCRFRIPKDRSSEGVYALAVDEHVRYIGECEDLSRRFNAGYGQISPRNAFEGGQSTNCKINHRILRETEQGNRVEVWFAEVELRREAEEELISRLQPEWNS